MARYELESLETKPGEEDIIRDKPNVAKFYATIATTGRQNSEKVQFFNILMVMISIL